MIFIRFDSETLIIIFAASKVEIYDIRSVIHLERVN
jgi:hypothetical protein